MQSNGKDLYFVAVKVFIEDNNGNFLITKDKFNNFWDITGGRLRPEDFDVDLCDVIKRKVAEELGENFEYELKDQIIYMRHERYEKDLDGVIEKRRIFAVGYKALYKGGNIDLGKNHEKYKWVSKINFQAEKYFEGGWLKGVKEYLKIK